ncbi:MAG: hypothetical protein ACW98F_05585 [Candidatus Hodarchaeales archaeon]|jgi:hypothetical protein
MVDVKFIKFGYFIGGCYDLILGFCIIFLPDILISVFGFTRPTPMIFVYTSGLFLLAVGYFLLYACFHDVSNYLFIGFGSSMVRIAFALIILLLWMTEGVDLVYILIAGADLFSGLLILLPILFSNGFTRKKLWIKDFS